MAFNRDMPLCVPALAAGAVIHGPITATCWRHEHPPPADIILSTTVFEVYVAAYDVTCLRQALAEGCHRCLHRPSRIEPSDGRQLACLLRLRREPPGCCRTADKRD